MKIAISSVIAVLGLASTALAAADSVDGATAGATAGDAARGQTIYSRCSACHTVTGQNRVGPHLDGVVGRRAGQVAGFNYSSALAGSNITWEVTSLDAYLAAPARRVPGTKMTVAVPNTQDRADIIAYLQTLRAQ